jgi:hypothetical protein
MVKKILVTMVILASVLLAPRPALAQCATQLADCYTAAAKIDNFWYRWAAGIDCEIDYAGCVRDAMFAE